MWRFRFAERGITKSDAKRQASQEQKLAAVKPLVVERLPANTPELAAWHQLRTRTLFEMKLVFKSPAFWVLALVGALNLFSTLNLAGRFYDVPMWPRTFAIVDVVRATSVLITLLMAIYFSGEVVWRERERRFSDIIDATPLPNWVFLISKLAGVVGVLLVLCVAVVLLESILFQFMRGLTDIEFGQWLAWFVAPSTLYVLQISVLAIVVQAISPNKFVGWGIMLLYLIAGTVFVGLGLNHPLLNYAEVPVPLLSDMNGANYGGAAGWWLRIYWTVVAAVLVVIGHLMWRRGAAVTVKGQWRTLPSRLRGKPLAFLSIALFVTIGMTGFIYYNMNILNHFGQYRSKRRTRVASYEKEYSKYVGLPQPTLTDVKLDVDLQPSRRVGTVRRQLSLRERDRGADRDAARPHRRRLVRVGGDVGAGREAGARGQAKQSPHLPVRPAAAAGRERHADLPERIGKRGFAALPADRQAYEFDAQPAPNGAYLTSLGFAPALGMNRSGFLQGNNLRRKHGLAAELPTPKREDDAALAKQLCGRRSGQHGHHCHDGRGSDAGCDWRAGVGKRRQRTPHRALRIAHSNAQLHHDSVGALRRENRRRGRRETQRLLLPQASVEHRSDAGSDARFARLLPQELRAVSVLVCPHHRTAGLWRRRELRARHGRLFGEGGLHHGSA